MRYLVSLLFAALACLLSFSLLGQSPCSNQTSVTYQGYEYEIVEIGDQCWFAENCRYFPSVSPSSEMSETDLHYYVYDYEGTDLEEAKATANYEAYGVLYNWPAVMTAGICPSGWHIPSDGEWQTMEISLGMSESEAAGTGWRGTDEGYQMKSTSGWNDGGNGSNSIGFTGLPGGYKSSIAFDNKGLNGYWWSSSESDSNSWYRMLLSTTDNVARYPFYRYGGFSARCMTSDFLVSNGCIDPTASNYNPEATEDDGSCCYEDSFWEQVGPTIIGEAAGDLSGVSSSLSGNGNIIAIGASSNDGNGFLSGHVRIYENIGGSWIQIGQDIDGEGANEQSGTSVSLSSDGSIVAIGAPFNDNSNGPYAGHVRVYENIGGTWTQIGQDIDGEDVSGGISVSLNNYGNILAIGERQYGQNITGSSDGRVRIFENLAGSWIQWGQSIDAEGAYDQFGHSVSLDSDGNTVAIGARNNDGNGIDAGHVRVFENTGGFWTQIGNDIDGEAAGDGSGNALSISSDGNIVAIGGEKNDGNGNNSGHVRVYENIGGIWTQIGQDIDGEAADDESGYFVATANNGNIVAIGGQKNDGNGNNSGHVRVYENIGGIWTQIGQDIDGEVADDQSGRSVSLSSNGSIVAIGSIFNEGNGIQAGHVRVYEINTSCISGCTIEQACNFNPEATDDDGSCLFVGESCDDGDETTANDTVQDDCSCSGEAVSGCTYSVACNYNPEATVFDDSCYFVGESCDDGDETTANDTVQDDCSCSGEAVSGCTYSVACNYNPEATVFDDSCYFVGDPCDDNVASTGNDTYNDECECEGEALQGGCTYEAACNYDPEAEFDNNTCIFVGDPCDDGDPNTLDDEIQEDCECTGTPHMIVEELMALSVLIYPNPASNNLTIDLGDLSGMETSIKIFDSSSRLVFEKLSSATLLIDVSGFAKGMYSIDLATGEQVFRSQVVIE
jgi:uncharacterized protein (TIGR02145 family)